MIDVFNLNSDHIPIAIAQMKKQRRAFIRLLSFSGFCWGSLSIFINITMNERSMKFLCRLDVSIIVAFQL